MIGIGGSPERAGRRKAARPNAAVTVMDP